VTIRKVESSKGEAGTGFIRLPFSLYRGCSSWVPPFRKDTARILDKNHPFFDHSDGAFFVVMDGNRPVGRIGLFENRRFNEKHSCNAATFFFFESVHDREISHALFKTAFEWARDRGLNQIIGPMFSPGVGGNGLLIDGFENRAAMTMASYNHPYYQELVEAEDFTKRRDYFSACLDGSFVMPEKIMRAAEITRKRGKFEVIRFTSKRELLPYVKKIGEMYNGILGSFNEAHLLTDREIEKVTGDLLAVADPSLIKVLTYEDSIVGFLIAFRDLSPALQKAHGRLGPLNILRLLVEYRRTKRIIVSGIGILPEYQRLGGNALLYEELEHTARGAVKNAELCDMVQIAESTWLMMRELENLGARIYKKHRLYERSL